MLPADFVNYPSTISNQDSSSSDANQQKSKHSKKKAYMVKTNVENDINADDPTGETTELTSLK